MMTSQKIDDGARRLSRGGEDGGGALGGGGDGGGGGGGGGDGGGDGGGGGDGILDVRTLDKMSLAVVRSHFGRPWATPAGEQAWIYNHQFPSQGAGRQMARECSMHSLRIRRPASSDLPPSRATRREPFSWRTAQADCMNV